MGFIKLMDEANYNFDAQKEGWIYGWTEKFVTENIEVMSPEIIKVAIEQLPPFQVYPNPTPQMQEQKTRAEQTLKPIIMTKGEKEQGRSMAA